MIPKAAWPITQQLRWLWFHRFHTAIAQSLAPEMATTWNSCHRLRKNWDHGGVVECVSTKDNVKTHNSSVPHARALLHFVQENVLLNSMDFSRAKLDILSSVCQYTWYSPTICCHQYIMCITSVHGLSWEPNLDIFVILSASIKSN